jgi:hypothetical protein
LPRTTSVPRSSATSSPLSPAGWLLEPNCYHSFCIPGPRAAHRPLPVPRFEAAQRFASNRALGAPAAHPAEDQLSVSADHDHGFRSTPRRGRAIYANHGRDGKGLPLRGQLGGFGAEVHGEPSARDSSAADESSIGMGFSRVQRTSSRPLCRATRRRQLGGAFRQSNREEPRRQRYGIDHPQDRTKYLRGFLHRLAQDHCKKLSRKTPPTRPLLPASIAPSWYSPTSPRKGFRRRNLPGFARRPAAIWVQPLRRRSLSAS